MDEFSIPHVLNLGDLELGYRIGGEPKSPVLLLLHGLGASSWTWHALASRYTRQFRVVAPDSRGHGLSTWTGSYDLPDMAADVSRVIDQLDLDNVTVVAHSMGAFVALLLAANEPDRVTRLILEEPPPPRPADPPRVEGQRPEGELTYDWAIQAQFSRQRNQPDPRWWSQLSRVTCPVTVIRGTRSHIGRAAVVDLVSTLPAGELIELDGGHDLHDEAADEFLAVLDQLLCRTE